MSSFSTITEYIERFSGDHKKILINALALVQKYVPKETVQWNITKTI